MADNTELEDCKIEDLGDTLRISIYNDEGCSGNVLFTIMALAWIIIAIRLIMVFVANLSTGFSGIGLLIAVIIIVGFGSYALLWSAWGKEVIEVSSSEIVIQRILLGIGSPKAYLYESIKGLSIETHRYSAPEGETPGNWSEITFGYKSKIKSFGRHRSPQELNEILEAIVRKYPQYKKRVIFTKRME